MHEQCVAYVVSFDQIHSDTVRQEIASYAEIMRVVTYWMFSESIIDRVASSSRPNILKTVTSFSLARDPNEETSVFRTLKKFACAMVRETNPVLLLHGGNYAAENKVDIEAELPFAFPYGMGGPTKKEELQYQKQKSSDDTYDSPCPNL